MEFHLTSDERKEPRSLGGKAVGFPYRWSTREAEPKRDDRDEVQLCAQCMCLEEMFGITISLGILYYGKTRRRVAVPMEEPVAAAGFRVNSRDASCL